VVDFEKLRLKKQLERSLAKAKSEKVERPIDLSMPDAPAGDKRLTVADLSKDQRVVHDAVLGWARGGASKTNRRDVFTFGGFAGTGKTSVLGVLAREFENQGLLVAYVTVTGRASSILARKLRAAGATITSDQRPTGEQGGSGFDSSLGLKSGPAFCGTFHRLVYMPMVNDEEEIIGWRKRKELDRQYDLVVIDEASMVSHEMLLEITAFDRPVLAVGDHGQLPPVASSGSIVENPRVRLEKIHRQAEGNPIIELSKVIREKGMLLDRCADGDRVRYVDKADLDQELRRMHGNGEGADSMLASLSLGMICHTNRVRTWLNAKMRKACGFSGKPRKGEPLLCLKNYPPIFNGMRGRLLEDVREGVDPAKPWLVGARVGFPEEGLPAEDLTLCAAQFNRHPTYDRVEDLRERGVDVRQMSDAGMLFDFGYCLTAHKSQGSEFDIGLVYLDREERPRDDDWRRWMYTSATRSKERLVIFR
jgi:exodeoxyribonuclease-5